MDDATELVRQKIPMDRLDRYQEEMHYPTAPQQWSPVIFPCTVFKDSGVAGDETTDCTWMYTLCPLGATTAASPLIKNPAGDPATAIPLDDQRLHLCTYSFAPDASLGLAMYDNAGLLHLIKLLNELPLELSAV